MLSRIDKRYTKDKFEKRVLSDLRRLKDLNKGLFEHVPVKPSKKNFIGTSDRLFLRKGTSISPKDKILLKEVLPYFGSINTIYTTRRVYGLNYGLPRWKYSKISDSYSINRYTYEHLPAHLKPLFDSPLSLYTIIWGDVQLLRKYNQYLVIKNVKVYKEYDVVTYTDVEAEIRRLNHKLWYEGDAWKVLHLGSYGRSSWDITKYKRSDHKLILTKILKEL